MNPFRPAPIILGLAVFLFFGWPMDPGYGKECEKTVDGATAACRDKNQDKYDILINLFELNGYTVSNFKSQYYVSGSDGQTQQSVNGELNGKWLHVELHLTGNRNGWAPVEGSYGLKQELKRKVKKKTIKSFERAESFNHRRSAVGFYTDNNGNKCSQFMSIKNEKLFIDIFHCNYTNQTIEQLKDYLSHKVKLVTRAENQAAYGNANRTTSASTSSSSSNTNRSIADKPEKGLCNLALTSANKGVMWDTGAGYRKYVDEAKRRGYTPASCAKSLGRTATVAKSTSSQSNTSDQSFKRKMCESSKTSSKVQASFMQSLSENELTKFLEAGQDCSIF